MLASFGYTHREVKSEVTGYESEYINGTYNGTRELQELNSSEQSNASAYIEKKITVDKNTKAITKDLKKTL